MLLSLRHYICAALLLAASATPSWSQSAESSGTEDPATRARTVLTDGSKEGDPAARREVAVTLSLLNSSDPATGLLDKLVKDGDALVREAAVSTIGEFGDKRRVPTLKAALNDEVPEVGFAAARSLFRLNEPEGPAVLESIVERETKASSGFLREHYRATMRKMKTPKSALLFSFQSGVGFLGIPGLGQGIYAMNSILLDESTSARATALAVLSRDKNESTKKLVLDSLDDDDWSVRATAVQAIVTWSEKAQAEKLIPLFADKNRKVRYHAAAAYLRLQSLKGLQPSRGRSGQTKSPVATRP